MSRRLTGRQVLDQIFAGDSDPADSESSEDEKSSSGSEFQVDSNDNDSDANDSDEADDHDVEENTVSRYGCVVTPKQNTFTTQAFIAVEKVLMQRQPKT
jgi:hypothetical protein